MPRSKKKAPKKGRNSKSQRGNPGSAPSRKLLQTTIPKASISFTTATASVDGRASAVGKASGCEVIGEVRTTVNLANDVNLSLNPANAVCFPRLSVLALAYERYRVRSLILRYHPACPATQSGLVGLMIDFDCRDNPPSSAVELAEHEAGAIGTVSAPLEVSATWPATDPFFLMTPDDSADAAEPQWRFPGKIFVITRDGATADLNKLAGYISVHYSFELLRLKPPVPQSISGTTAASSNALGINAQTPMLEYSPNNLVGWWDWSHSSRAVFPAVSGTITPIGGFANLKYNNTVGVVEGQKVSSSFVVQIGAESAFLLRDELKSLDRDQRTVRPPLIREPSRSQVGDVEDQPARQFWANPAFDPTLSKAELLRMNPSDFKSPLRPRVANDVTISLLCANLADGVIDTIFEWLQNDALSFVFQTAASYTAAKACRVFFGASWPTTDTRSLGVGRVSHVTVEEVD